MPPPIFLSISNHPATAANHLHPADTFGLRKGPLAASLRTMPDDGTSDSGELMTEECPHCGMLIDVRGLRAYTRVHCPSCGGALHVRRSFNQYEIIEVIGEGGMGTVYKALDRNLMRYVALKVLKEEFSNNPDSITELAREAKITASISHPNVVKVFSFGEAYGQYFFAMELVEKGSLDDLMMLQKRIAEAQTLNIGIQISMGLQAAYAKGLIHSDVKPGNILFADAKTAKIVDFGLAFLQEQQADEKGEIWGTPYYVPPERLNKEKEDFRSDIYSLGGTLFHALAGRPPFEAENASLVALKHLKSKAVSLQAFAPDVSSETAYVINRMLQKEVDERYASYDELIEHLTYAKERLLARVASGKTKRQTIQVESDQSKLVGGLATLGMLLALVVIGWLVWSTLNPAEDSQAGRSGPTSEESKPVSDREVVAHLAKARRLAAAFHYGQAIAELDSIPGVDSLRQPLLNWYRLQRGLMLLLDGRRADAEPLFAALDREDLYSRDPAQLPLANFFKESGRLMKDDRPISSNAVSLFKRDNYESLALLLFGVKNWQMGAFESSAKLLQAYTNAQVGSSDSWVMDYAPVAKRLLDDYERLKTLQERLNKAASKQDLQALLADVKQARTKMTTGADLAKPLAQLEVETERAIENFGKVIVVPRTTPTPQATTRPQATPKTTPTPAPTPDPVAIAAELTKLDEIAAQLRPTVLASGDITPLQKRLAETTASSPSAADRKQWLAQRLDWLKQFRDTLVSDINSQGYDQPIPRRSGASLRGRASSADGQGLRITIPYGELPLAWRDIAPDTQVALAEHFAKAVTDPADRARRLWTAGIFAREAGLPDRAKPLLIEAAKQSAEFKDTLDRALGGD